MSYSDLSQYRSYLHWMNTLTSSSTRRVWTHCLRNYCKWRNLSPDELITKRERDLSHKDSLTLNDEELQLHRYILYLEYQEVSSSWRRVCWTVVRNFFQKNYLPLKIFRGEGPKVEMQGKESIKCTVRELNLMLKSASTRERALILFLAHAGLPTSAVARLTIGDLGTAIFMKPVNIKKITPPVKLHLTNRKFGIEARSLLSSEAWSALRSYLNQRIQGNLEKEDEGHLRTRVPSEKLDDSTPLFCSYGKWGKDRIPVIKSLAPSSISMLVKKVAKRAGVYERGFSAGALRRFFKKALLNAGVKSDLIRIMMGYKNENRKNSDRVASWKDIQRAYVRAKPHLSGEIDEKITKTSEEELRSELERTKLQLKKERVWRIIFENSSIKDENVLKTIFKECMKAKNKKVIQKILCEYEKGRK